MNPVIRHQLEVMVGLESLERMAVKDYLATQETLDQVKI